MKILNKMCIFFSDTYKYGMTFLGFSVLLFLTILNMTNTCFLNTGEHVFITRDSLILNLLMIVLITTIFSSAWDQKAVQKFIQKIESDDKLFIKIRRILLSVILALSVIWILITQVKPGADQEFIQDAVLAIKEKNFSYFQLNGYISKYPNQIGFFTISYLYSMIFGDNNYIGFQLINALCVTYTYKVFADIQENLGFKRIHQLLMTLIGILFLPLIFYSTFIYGTLPGLMLSLIAIKREIMYFHDYKIKNIIICALTIALSIMCKNNYLIVFIAVLLYAVVEIIAQQLWKKAWVFILFASFFYIQATVPTMYLEHVTDTKLNSGITSWAWVAMGLQESPLTCGWYNGYNEITYLQAKSDPDKQKEISKEAINASIQKFKDDKEYAKNFFAKKYSSMWSEPSYESIWITQIRLSNIETSTLAWKLLSISGSHPIILFLNFFQTFILFGSLLYFALCRNNACYRQSLIFIMTFIGGFIFHTVWEAKG
ncbi:MAG: hypothetical protein IKN54_05525, partial [Lachnospiraceae bacterium]|nr:hypothetical protein [Lachnospiraceae bacterium]